MSEREGWLSVPQTVGCFVKAPIWRSTRAAGGSYRHHRFQHPYAVGYGVPNMLGVPALICASTLGR